MIDNAQTSNINNYFGTSENNSNLDSFQYIQTQFTNGGEINSTNISKLNIVKVQCQFHLLLQINI